MTVVQVLKDLMVLKVKLVQVVDQVLRVIQARRVLKVFKDYKADWVTKDLKAQAVAVGLALSIAVRRGRRVDALALLPLAVISAAVVGVNMLWFGHPLGAVVAFSSVAGRFGNLGQTEAKAIMVRLLAPAATIGWQVSQNYGNLAQNASKLLGMGK